MKGFFNEEKGNVSVLFAFMSVVLIGFVGMSVDLTLLYMKQNELANLCQIVRQDRFTYQDEIRFGDNPALICYEHTKNTLIDENNFNGDFVVYYSELNPADPNNWNPSRREYKVQVQLSDDYSFCFLRLFGMNSVKLTQKIDGGQIIGEGGEDMIWHPSGNIADYRGSISGTSGRFVKGDLPSGW